MDGQATNDDSADMDGAAASGGMVRDLAAAIRENIQKVIVGKSENIDLLLAALLSRGHVLIEDVPGTGKTTLAKALAASLDCAFSRVQFTPDLIPSDVLGVNIYDPKEMAFEFRAGPIFTQIFLADEINRATPRTQSALLESMQENQVSIDGETRPLDAPFFVLATLNPVEMEGTFPLPEAQLDRFLIRLELGYPTPDEEAAMLARFENQSSAPSLQSVVGISELSAAQDMVDQVRVDDIVRSYILGLVQATRHHEHIRLGASPRAALALQKASQAKAAIVGRDFVQPDDVKDMAAPVLAHRLNIDTPAMLRGLSAKKIVADVLDSVPVPIER